MRILDIEHFPTKISQISIWSQRWSGVWRNYAEKSLFLLINFNCFFFLISCSNRFCCWRGCWVSNRWFHLGVNTHNEWGPSNPTILRSVKVVYPLIMNLFHTFFSNNQFQSKSILTIMAQFHYFSIKYCKCVQFIWFFWNSCGTENIELFCVARFFEKLIKLMCVIAVLKSQFLCHNY